VETGALGEPRLLVDGGPSELQLSIAHSGEWFAVALASQGRAGVDIEAVRPRKRLHEIADYLGWGEEIANLGEFLDRWTLWEACVKLERSTIFSTSCPSFEALSRNEGKERTFGCAPWLGVRSQASEDMHFALVLKLERPQGLRVRNLDPDTLAPLAVDSTDPGFRFG